MWTALVVARATTRNRTHGKTTLFPQCEGSSIEIGHDFNANPLYEHFLSFRGKTRSFRLVWTVGTMSPPRILPLKKTKCSCRRGTGRRVTACVDKSPRHPPRQVFLRDGWGGTGGRKLFCKKAPFLPPVHCPSGQMPHPQAGEGGQKHFEMYADSAKLTRLCPKTHQP